MSGVSSLSNFKPKWYRLGSRYYLYFFSFILGCTLTICFISSMECPKSNVDIVTSTETYHISNDNDKTKKKKLVVIIPSAIGNIMRRHALRRTWLSLADHNLVQYYFVVGTKNAMDANEQIIFNEERHYSDLLILPELEDSYELLTNKLLASFVWVDKNLEYDFLLKVDDDSYVDMRQLFRELLRKSGVNNLYWGYFNGHAKVQQKGKWIEKNWNLCDRYLPYARGGGYVLASQLVHYIAQNAMLLNIYRNEDVSVGAWLAPVNLTRIHDIHFDTEWTSRGCSNEHLITHPHEVEQIYKLHEDLTTNGLMCQPETVKRPAYYYDWGVLPSQCCKNNA